MKSILVIWLFISVNASAQVSLWGMTNNCSKISSSCKALKSRGCSESRAYNIFLPASNKVEKINCNMTYADHNGKIGGYMQLANKAAADGVYFPVNSKALGFYDYPKTVNGTFSNSLANFSGKPGTILLKSGSYVVEVRWNGSVATPTMIRLYASGLANKMYSITCSGDGADHGCSNNSSVAISDALFVPGSAFGIGPISRSGGGLYEGGCAIYSRSRGDTYGYGETYDSLGIVSRGWGRGEQYWCPYGIGGYGDGGTVNNPVSPSSYVGYPWGAMNYQSGSGTAVEIWFRED